MTAEQLASLLVSLHSAMGAMGISLNHIQKARDSANVVLMEKLDQGYFRRHPSTHGMAQGSLQAKHDVVPVLDTARPIAGYGGRRRRTFATFTR